MLTDPSLNESNTLRRNGRSWLVIAPWLCLLWVGIAFCTFWITIDNIDVDGSTKTEFQPYEPLITVIVYIGLIALPIGFCCGLLALSSRKDPEFLSLPPTLLLGFLLTGSVLHQYREYQRWNQWNTNPPIVVPASDRKTI